MTADSDHQTSPFTPLTGEEELRLWPLAVHARHLLQKLHYVDYQQAEADAALLAQKIRGLYTRNDLRNAAFTAIPRGGLVVLGLLAYQLDLRPEQLMAGAADKAPAELGRAQALIDEAQQRLQRHEYREAENKAIEAREEAVRALEAARAASHAAG